MMQVHLEGFQMIPGIHVPMKYIGGASRSSAFMLRMTKSSPYLICMKVAFQSGSYALQVRWTIRAIRVQEPFQFHYKNDYNDRGRQIFYHKSAIFNPCLFQKVKTVQFLY